jgi:hypothetical protein
MRIGLRRAVTFCAAFVTCVVATACATTGSTVGTGARASDAMPEWFHLPCLEDSVDDFGWALHEVMGITLRVPTEFRREKVPAVDELHFRRGQSTLDLYVRRDASRIFAGYAESAVRHRYCEGPIGGWIAEALSFREGFYYGFVARWADASQGEYLAAVIRGATVRDATLLRQTLFTLRFPGQKR